ncbi:ras-like protein [Anaeramoeba flamelloides]|uniref:small monomeric GTPase n=1 Tax=Anaeramoeba flamelloides TaxID=1746091 RepID=A0AAV7Z995_9EUKA|nr:ras-like protein [Anaeramoeba flamelloides]KAJ6233145.1 ras-like protein [Anaeramoeba flamelloides]
MTEYKIVVVGGGGVGKTALTVQFVDQFFIQNYDPTIEDSYRKQVVVDEETCLLDILDTAGEDEYSAMRDSYIRESEGFLIVYSIIHRASFLKVQDFYGQIQIVKNFEESRIILVGNKNDLEEQRQVLVEEGKLYANSIQIPFIETSAKSKDNIQKAFFHLVRMIRKTKFTSETERQKPKTEKKKKRFFCQIL